MNKTIEIVSEKDWPEVKNLLVSSLHELDFYESLEPNLHKRSQFLEEYMEMEYYGSNTLFWCGKTRKTEEAKLNDLCYGSPSTKNHERKIFIVGMLISPQGIIFNKQNQTMIDMLTLEGAHNLLLKTEEAGSRDCTERYFSLHENYPNICKKLQSFRLWYKGHTNKIRTHLQKEFWQCCHIAVSPEYRQAKMAVFGMKEAIRTFFVLTEVSDCRLLLVNTGVMKCHFVVKKAGCCDVTTLHYQGKPRWLMTYLMAGSEVENEEVAAMARESLA